MGCHNQGISATKQEASQPLTMAATVWSWTKPGWQQSQRGLFSPRGYRPGGPPTAAPAAPQTDERLDSAPAAGEQSRWGAMAGLEHRQLGWRRSGGGRRRRCLDAFCTLCHAPQLGPLHAQPQFHTSWHVLFVLFAGQGAGPGSTQCSGAARISPLAIFRWAALASLRSSGDLRTFRPADLQHVQLKQSSPWPCGSGHGMPRSRAHMPPPSCTQLSCPRAWKGCG